jgi:hypothetical protein
MGRNEQPNRTAILRDRALRCRQLADGVGDPGFAKKLYALSDEYEGRKKRPIMLDNHESSES